MLLFSFSANSYIVVKEDSLMGYKILNYDFDEKEISEYGLPYKNKLPKEVRDRLFTRKQWLEKGYVLKEEAKGYPMHSQKNYKNRVVYYLDYDVIPIHMDNTPQNCLTCLYRESRGYCVVAGNFVGEINSCLEWVNKYAE